ncbi:MAG: PH domain-containing protein [Anaerolineales bacterium]|nr:PH domain-containing protein [Anaerolineales bacterium]
MHFRRGPGLDRHGRAGYLHSEYRVTTQRLILQGGILSQRTTEIYRDRIDSLAMQTSPLGRMFGYGDVVVYSGGQLIQTLRAVANPEELRRQILGQVNQ